MRGDARKNDGSNDAVGMRAVVKVLLRLGWNGQVSSFAAPGIVEMATLRWHLKKVRTGHG